MKEEFIDIVARVIENSHMIMELTTYAHFREIEHESGVSGMTKELDFGFCCRIHDLNCHGERISHEAKGETIQDAIINAYSIYDAALSIRNDVMA